MADVMFLFIELVGVNNLQMNYLINYTAHVVTLLQLISLTLSPFYTCMPV